MYFQIQIFKYCSILFARAQVIKQSQPISRYE